MSRDQILSVRLTDAERDELKAVAETLDTDMSNLVRQLVRDLINSWLWKRKLAHPVAPTDFRSDLAATLNRWSIENGSDTPDYILADHLVATLAAFNTTVARRDSVGAAAMIKKWSMAPYPGGPL